MRIERKREPGGRALAGGRRAVWAAVAWLSLLAVSVASVCAGPSLRGNLGIHDPSTVIKCKDRYYIFGTGQGIISKSSADHVYWTSGPSVFSSPPAWTTNAVSSFTGYFWAPDIFYLNGKYCIYYSISSWGSQVSAIGLVTNPTLDPTDAAYKWTDQGQVIASTTGSPYNTIDPCAVRDANGNPWLVYGSYWNGIYIVQLDPTTGLRIATNSPTYRLAYNSSIEASCIYRRGSYYYLFANWGSCCVGVNSTYNIRVGRSSSITGPYLDRNGVDMAANGGTLFLEGTGKFTGPGHMGVMSENGTEWFSYHYYDANAWAPWYSAFGPARFDLQPLSWTADEWPVFTNDWSAVYNFQADASDDNRQYYGLLLNGASITNDSTRGRVLNLNGTNQYVRLPPGVAYARTFSAVVKWNGGSAWQRIFDFGTDTSRYVMLTPSSSNNRIRLDIRANGTTQTLEATYGFPIGVWTHVAVTLDGRKGTLYVNGAPVATNSSITLSPLDVLAQTNYLGHSKFTSDPDFNGQIACFRAYGRVLSAAEIAAPLPVMTQPADGATYWPGGSVAFSGTAVDFMDLPLSAGAMSWKAEYIQDGKTNIVFGPKSGITNGTLNVPTNSTGGGILRVGMTATDSGGRQRTVWTTLSPANPPAPSSSYYPFRSDAQDANDRYDGTLNGGAAIVADGTRGSAVSLSGTNQFISLPPGAASFQTFMAWVNWNGGAAWQRILDFGSDTTRYCVLTPLAANGKMRFDMSASGIAGEQMLDAPGALATGIWTHVALTLDGSVGILYTNGVAIATNANLNRLPGTLGVTNNYLGKSQFPDPYFSGRLSSVRLFSRALGPAEIAAPQVVIAQPAHGRLYLPGESISFSGSASDFYDAAISATSLAWTVKYVTSAATNTVLSPAAGTTNGSFNIPSGGSTATNGLYRFILTATDSASRRATNSVDIFPAASAVGSDWSSYYSFTSNALDSSNRFNGSLMNGATIATDATRGKVLELPGGNQYVSLPAGAGAFRTISGWVKWDGGAAWQRLFDFGVNTAAYAYLTPLNGAGQMQFAITVPGGEGDQLLQAPFALPTNVWTHLAVVLDGRQGILYVNGEPVAVNNSLYLLPSDVAATKCYLGRSQFSADAYFNGQLDSLRLNSRPVSLADLTAPMPIITRPVPGTLFSGGDSVAFAGTAIDYAEMPLAPSTLTWSGEFHHDGLVDAAFGPLTGVTNGSYSVSTNGPASTNVFHRINLIVKESSGVSLNTAVDMLPRISTLNFATVPAGLNVALDGQAVATSASIAAVAGMARTVSAPSPQSISGTNANFILWSDGGAASHTISVPSTNATFTASFLQPTVNMNLAGSSLFLSWPSWAAPLKLTTATNLTPPVAWALVPNTPVANGGFLTVTLPWSDALRFYRLQSL